MNKEIIVKGVWRVLIACSIGMWLPFSFHFLSRYINRSYKFIVILSLVLLSLVVIYFFVRGIKTIIQGIEDNK